ncbi:hypothetical protein IC229_07535 [Spirosoma sp. BT702]|uniref:DUF3471 domain-containing protein n=1 Tax=Spirosoma profusum TaxID=2771354 RepID=A0A927AQI0_9BACT|nr:hypothetical protein [Spirosoma profusum]MBD2700481.1 hypothetical protein [Spirosoma profusum]
MTNTSVWKQICFLVPICLSYFAVFAASQSFDTYRISYVCTPPFNNQLKAAGNTPKKDGLYSPGRHVHDLTDSKEMQLPDSLLTEFCGDFDFVDFPSMQIYLSNGNLYAETSQGKSILKKLPQKDSFEIVDYQARLKFNRNDKGAILNVELDAHGFTSTGQKRKRSE